MPPSTTTPPRGTIEGDKQKPPTQDHQESKQSGSGANSSPVVFDVFHSMVFSSMRSKLWWHHDFVALSFNRNGQFVPRYDRTM
jgi:hypothetical protein